MNDNQSGKNSGDSFPTADSTVAISGEVQAHDGLAGEERAAKIASHAAGSATATLEPKAGTGTESLEDHLQDAAERAQLEWFRNVYQGENVPQLTWRAVLLGGFLGAMMSLSNLYTMLKLGWAFGVAITACVLSFVIWNAVRLASPRITAMSILENNCMQSTASAAGYSTGATISTAFGAYLLITGHQIDWRILLPWTLLTAALGVFLAVPMKRQMINHEQLPFPSGIAAAETLRSLYSRSKQAVQQAYALVAAMVVGGLVGFFRNAEFAWQKASGLKIPDLLPFNYKINGGSFPGFGFEPSVLLIGAGMIVGMRVSLSMFLGSALLYLVVGPTIAIHEIASPAKLISGWGLWTGTAIMVTSGLTAFALQWKTIVRSFGAFKSSTAGGTTANAGMQGIEVPTKWFLIGVIPLGFAMAVLQYLAFSIAVPLGIFAVVMSFFLALVAARSTGETDITPISAMGKITQLAYAALSPTNATTNLMTASVTANTAISCSDLLVDLKSGYLLGANPRKQFLAQFAGIFFGTAAVVPAWYLMVPDKAHLEAFNPPSTNMWLAVAQALTHGISYVPITARYGMLIGGTLGILLAVAEHFYPKSRKFLPSAMGLGLAWVVTFSNAFSFLIGAVIASVWRKVNEKNAETFTVPIASGAIAGESLACALIAIISAAVSLAHH